MKFESRRAIQATKLADLGSNERDLPGKIVLTAESLKDLVILGRMSAYFLGNSAEPELDAFFQSCEQEAAGLEASK